MRTLWTSLLLALALIAGLDTREARACDLQDASGSACGQVLLVAAAGHETLCAPMSPSGPIAAVSSSADEDADHEGSDQGPERVDSDASLVATIGLDAPASSAQLHRSVTLLEPDTPAADRTQQPPRS